LCPRYQTCGVYGWQRVIPGIDESRECFLSLEIDWVNVSKFVADQFPIEEAASTITESSKSFENGKAFCETSIFFV
ncbi:MAG: hypothetical protein P1V97_03150, partial [Planctomycetota bacterium]|nr:hypothetical protein [Planctomycetota bacterium]